MKKLLVAFLLLTSFATWQCTSAHEAELKELDAELIKGHDAVMPQTMKLEDLKKEVLEKAAAMQDSSQKKYASDVANQLQKASDDMYKWMDDYSKAINEEKDEAKKLETFKRLLDEIRQIDRNTHQAVESANGL